MIWLLDGLYLILGLVLLPYWLWKVTRAERYRAGLPERLGLSPKMRPDVRRLWIHCASVGEASIPESLVPEFQRRHPDWQVVFSTNTNTGAARLRDLYGDAPVFYMPLDFSFCVRRVLQRVRPDVVLLVELELWPNLADACRAQGVPVAIINGCISGASRRGLRILCRFLPKLWDAVRVCCARSADDAAGFRYAGLPGDRVFTCGSLKCDNLALDPQSELTGRLRHLFGIAPGAPVLVAGSTHEGEEAALLAAYRDLKLTHRDLRLILAPRHIERARQVVAAVRARGIPVAERTALESGRIAATGDEVIVLDTIGELTACYALATCAFVGNSLVTPGGGHNMMEAAALGKPVLVGPHTANFKPEMGLLTATGTAVVVRGRRGLVKAAARLLSDPQKARSMGEAALAVIRESRGATRRTLNRLEPLFAGRVRPGP